MNKTSIKKVNENITLIKINRFFKEEYQILKKELSICLIML